jgi:hypothetical protein
MVLISPLPVLGRANINHWIDTIFMAPTAWIRNTWFPNAPKYDGFYTDSLNYLILLAFAVSIGVLLAFAIQKSRLDCLKIEFFTKKTLVYYLSWIFLIYGFSKILGVQFPENMESSAKIFINVDNLDLHFWSYMGKHRSLVNVLGITEILIASLMLLNKSRKLGVILFTTALMVIVVINIKFEISVRLFSVLLLIAGIYSSIEHLHNFTSSNNTYIDKIQDNKHRFAQFNIRKPMKLFLIALMFITAIFNSL